MMQRIHDLSKGWVTWVLFSLIAITFSFWGVQRFVFGNDGSSQAKTIATVNGQAITEQQLQSNYQRLLSSAKDQPGFVLDPTTEKSLKQNALSHLILNNLLADAAFDRGFRVTTGQLDTLIAAIPAFQEDGRFSPQRFSWVLNKMMYSEAGFLDEMRSGILLNQVRVGITKSSFVLPSEYSEYFKVLLQQRDINYMLIPKNKFSQLITIKPDKIKTYYTENQDQFKTDEAVSIAYIELSLPEIQKNLQLSDKTLETYYKNNIDSFSRSPQYHVAHILIQKPATADAKTQAETQTKLANIEKAIAKGEDFASLAKQYSNDITTKNDGGLLPWFGVDTANPQILNTVVNMKAGDVSKPFVNEYGYEIIKLIAVKPKQVMPFAEVKTQVKNRLVQEKAQEIFANSSEQLANLTYANPESLQAAAHALNLPIKKSKLFTRSGGDDALLQSPKIVAVAFSQDVLQNGNNSNVIQLDPEKQIVLRVDSHQAAAVKSLAQVTPEIITILREQIEADTAKRLGQTLLGELKKGKSFADLAASNHLTITKVANVERYNKKVPAEIIIAAFDAPMPKGKIPGFADTEMSSGDYAVLEVTGVSAGDLAKSSAKDRTDFMQTIDAMFARQDYASYVKDVTTHAKIKYQKDYQQFAMNGDQAIE